MHTYAETTHDIEVKVVPNFLADESRPEQSVFVFSYDVEIINHGSQTVQLLSRHWIITDGNGKVEEVKGPGVVGEQPVLKPGARHQYQSFCPLRTPQGNMRGSFQFQVDKKNTIDVKIPLFFLRSDLLLH